MEGVSLKKDFFILVNSQENRISTIILYLLLYSRYLFFDSKFETLSFEFIQL